MEAPARPQQRLSNSYLGQAVDALEFAGSAPMLYRSLEDDALLRQHGPDHEVVRGRARWEHQIQCRTSALFAALAAESYVNEFLAAALPPRDLDALDRLSTPEKYIAAVRAAIGGYLFTRGEEPHNSIVELFNLRRKLVHPKPGFGPVNPYFDSPGDFEALFSPTRVVRYVAERAGGWDSRRERLSARTHRLPLELHLGGTARPRGLRCCS